MIARHDFLDVPSQYEREGDEQPERSREAETITAACRGDAAAQRMFFQRHSARVARQILRMTGDPAAVDDLTQEVFIAAFDALSRFRGASKVETWMYTIAANKVRNWWDANKRRRKREQRGTDGPREAPATPEDEFVRSRHAKRLYAALGRLPAKYREAFIARGIEKLSLKDAAEALGVGSSTLLYRARRAEQLLCEELGIPREQR